MPKTIYDEHGNKMGTVYNTAETGVAMGLFVMVFAVVAVITGAVIILACALDFPLETGLVASGYILLQLLPVRKTGCYSTWVMVFAIAMILIAMASLIWALVYPEWKTYSLIFPWLPRPWPKY